MHWLSTSLRIASLVGATFSLLAVTVEVNKIQNLMTIPYFLQIIRKWSLPLDVANVAVVLLATVFTRPQLSSRDLVLSLLWFFTATINLLANIPVAKIYRKHAVMSHVRKKI